MKDHKLAELVNSLNKIAWQYHAHDCLRSKISSKVGEALQEYKDNHKSMVSALKDIIELGKSTGNEAAIQDLANDTLHEIGEE